MKMKKSWFSYPLWLFYAVLTGVLLAVYLVAISMQVWHLNQYITAALVTILFGAVGGVWFGGRKAAVYLNRRFAGDRHLANMWECFLVLGLTAAALLYRFRLLLYSDGVVEASRFYDMAVVKAGEGVPAMAHGASYIYTVFLSLVLSFAGNKVIAGVVLQLFLEIAVILVFYLGVRLLTGRIEAVCVMAVMTFASVFGDEMFRLTPEMLYLLLYAAGILLLGICARRYSMIGFICAGIYIGLIGYLDLAGWTLLLPGVWIGVRETMGREEKVWKHCLRPCALVVSALAAMLVVCGINAFVAGQSLGNGLAIWFGNYAVDSMIGFPAGPDYAPGIGIVVCFFAALAVVDFWFQEKQKQDGWILLLAVFSILDMLGVGMIQYEIFLTAIWGVLAGIGITSMCTEVQNEECIQDEKVPFKELVVEEITLEEAPAKVQLIENPLPLPKKHVKKEMDYDHEVDENDDFDI